MASSTPASRPFPHASGDRGQARRLSRPSTKNSVTGSTSEQQLERLRRWLVGGAGTVALIVLVWMIWVRLPPPQMKTDEQVFQTVDALFTALTSRDKSRLKDCEQRLKGYHAEGKTTDAVAARLNAVIKQAHEEKWEPAAKTLYDFIIRQRGGS